MEPKQGEVRMKKLERFFCKNHDKPTRIALGTLYFGSKISQYDSEKILDTYFEIGGNQIDTARSYANWLPNGESASEKTVGEWLHKSGMREKVFLGTKGGLMPRGYNECRANLSRTHLLHEIEKSLECLRTDYIDIYWLHRDEVNRPVEEIIDICDEFVKKGIVRYIGVSNWNSKRIEKANAYAKLNKKTMFSMSQIQFGFGICTRDRWGDYSVVCMDDTEYTWYKQNNMPVYAFSAQAQGFFSIVNEKGLGYLTEDTKTKYGCEENIQRAERLKKLCSQKGISSSAVVMDYVLSREFPTVFLLGCSKAERVKEVQSNINIHLSDNEWKYLLNDNEKNLV